MNDRLESEMKLLQTTTERLLQESSQTQQQLIQHYEGVSDASHLYIVVTRLS